MKTVTRLSKLAVMISLLFVSVKAQDVPTTLVEMFGEDGFTIQTEYKTKNLSSGNWAQGSSMPFPRYYGGSVMYSRNDTLWLYVIGGDTTGSGDATAACLRYNVNTDTWEYIASLPEPLRTNAVTIIQDKIYTMGGFNAPFPALSVNSFYEYDINTNTWTQLTDLPNNVFFHSAESFEDSLIYILGGIDDSPQDVEVPIKAVYLYNRNDDNFREATEMQEASASFGSVRVGDKFYLTAGLKSTTELWNHTFEGEINNTNRANITWTAKANYPLSIYAHYGAAFSDEELYWYGGSTTTGFTPIDNVNEYHTMTNIYQADDPLPYKAMAFHGGIGFRNLRSVDELKIVVSGGITEAPESKGVVLTGQTWVFTDTISVQGLNEVSSESPVKYVLSQNYPNPFNPSTTIKFSIPEEGFVSLSVFNALGENVSNLVSEELNAGSYKYEWSAENLTSGIYFYRLQTSGFSESKKMLLIK
ncbi:MAG: T9SS type A sorting domain-containing protein [Ignavibacteria bacterium]|nr:T9SS type A sorting domain-containing protein [Ignavibacteria bacterium]MBT8383320.1 T9SS type A sorting domain-containing protein [Ignavibacteria bacterium]MBT8391392.1 T9SS type A sorting domain-containing protein [Ignavibacteria bacterium]NNJ52430.1 T9SS type A sorting domain-containing protein [Ignavibacteriaceae bacterium]NNL22557.1 T9SS type A sorting domain-containing protein [Ignavibacteriaceae bacterium]